MADTIVFLSCLNIFEVEFSLTNENSQKKWFIFFRKK